MKIVYTCKDNMFFVNGSIRNKKTLLLKFLRSKLSELEKERITLVYD